jgi:predicted phage terminase large subunit-like protein
MMSLQSTLKPASSRIDSKADPTPGRAELIRMAEAREALTLRAEKAMYAECESSLHAFIKHAWRAITPSHIFVDNWHITSICAHLEAVTRGEILRLVINIPPRFTKSTIVSVMWPVWVWLQDATKRFLTGSHKDSLAIRDMRLSRILINSPWFQKGWAGKFMFSADQNQKQRYENDQHGVRLCFGMNSGVTGEGGDILIVDDPHKAQEGMFSQTARQNVIDMFDQELSTRLNDPKKSAIVIIMQRLHEDDLTGHVLGGGGWEHLCFPMEYEPARKCVTCLGVQDIRTRPGELLCDDRFGREYVDDQKRNRLGTYGVSGQYQQAPVPAGGGIIKLDWFRYYGILPSNSQRVEVVQCWDTAQKANELLNCPWVCGTWIRTATGYYLADVYREWLTYPQGKRMVKSMAEKWTPNAIVIEDKSTGSSLIQELSDGTLPVVPFEPEGDKITRLSVESPTIEAGNVWLPESAGWLPDFLSEIGSFPLSSTMDQADMLSMALKYFRTRAIKMEYESTGIEHDYVQGMSGW